MINYAADKSILVNTIKIEGNNQILLDLFKVEEKKHNEFNQKVLDSITKVLF
nr:hypothetical protein [Dinophyceae sp. MRD-151]